MTSKILRSPRPVMTWVRPVFTQSPRGLDQSKSAVNRGRPVASSAGQGYGSRVESAATVPCIGVQK